MFQNYFTNFFRLWGVKNSEFYFLSSFCPKAKLHIAKILATRFINSSLLSYFCHKILESQKSMEVIRSSSNILESRASRLTTHDYKLVFVGQRFTTCGIEPSRHDLFASCMQFLFSYTLRKHYSHPLMK